MDKTRTTRQNSALHLMFTQLADTLTENGLDMKKTLKPEIDIKWTPENVKEYLWRPIQVALLNKKSTTELTTKEIDQVFDIICKHLGEKFGLTIYFPSIESLINQQRTK